MERKTIYNYGSKASSILMILVLLWLTVSLPFVYAAQQHQLQKKASTEKTTDDQSCNPLTNITEEKTPPGSANSLSEEHLHHTDDEFHIIEIFLHHQTVHTAEEYVAYHGELLSPPPEV